MAKLSYTRDVKPLALTVQNNIDRVSGRHRSILIHNLNDTYSMTLDGAIMATGTLREVYNFLMGMNWTINDSKQWP